MLNVFNNKSQFHISKENKARIDSEIEKLSTLSNGIYSKVKENELGFYIKIIVDRNKLGNEFKSQSSLPECITFLMIVDYSFPSQPPKILSKTNVLILLINLYSLVFQI